ncbi:MAG TPA: cytochrome c3 family protein [Thermoanaerobaculia bacterium]|nr:cytochrome c3 family protein [Thermoanaerobaculia bacterium]
MRRLWLAAIAALCCTVTVTAKDGAFRSTRHGDPVKGPQRKLDHPAGSCVQCHDGHSRHNDRYNAPPSLGADSSELCLDCHTLAPLDGGSFPGVAAWTAGAHARERMERPNDPAVQSRNACVACHDPHGVRDARGVIPALLAQRERDLCLGCHDGVRGADIRNELQKTYWHGQNARGEHDPVESRSRDPIDTAPLNRHVTCSDCHNAHVARADRGGKYDGEASDRLTGVARVQVVHGAAGAQPSYRWIAPNDPAPAWEFEICFKCHSSAVRQLPQSEDLARTTNPANPSFHPIQARGRNRNIDANAFAGGMSAESRIRCSDCHSGDSSRVRGPHGSSHEHLLRRRYASDGSLPMARTDLCFDCHAWAVYADAASDVSLLAASRFNAPSGAGHAFHTGAQRIHCSACHEPHGSMRQPALIAVRQRPGITSYIQTQSGGTCTPTCHVTRSYKVSYPR